MGRAVLEFTPAALARLSELGRSGKVLRLDVAAKGCSGNSYVLEEVDSPPAGDEPVVAGLARVSVSPRALLKVIGSTMDWRDSGFSRGFIFSNPNEKGRCGCGESFLA